VRLSRIGLILLTLFLVSMSISACGDEETPSAGNTPAASSSKVLTISGIPDQDTAILVRRFEGVAAYLSQKLGVQAKYVPTVDYAAVVTGFKNGDIHLAWFGGLTGVQAMKAVSGAQAIAQRKIDAEFHSVFIVQKNLPAQKLSDLNGYTFTFGSESSTSGHLMPRYFLQQAGVDADKDFKGLPNYSGSHDTTWKLVESGTFQAGALNEGVWARAVRENQVDQNKVRLLETTPPYFDYNWTVRPDLDETFGDGFTQRLKQALLDMGNDPAQKEIMAAFNDIQFIETKNENYAAIEEIAKRLGLLE
jgi:phosphonate transport system substrate-binding protein